jgi:pimeloyl-ACP methyl ester carboxylesterase
MSASIAEQWRSRGGYFSWSPDASADEVQVFHVEAGDPEAPPLLLVHGFPTSSIDWSEVVDPLAERFRVCALDFPGYGFSDKPVGWGYSLFRDAQLLGHYLTEVIGTDRATVLAHDRGDSVALILAGGHAEGGAAVAIERLFLMNANIFLGLSNLTDAQRMMLDAETAPTLLGNATPELLAAGMGAATFFPPRGPDDPAVQALAETFAHADGLAVMHETIQYLVERSADETKWLESLAPPRSRPP